jgi:hypothetical protein
MEICIDTEPESFMDQLLSACHVFSGTRNFGDDICLVLMDILRFDNPEARVLEDAFQQDPDNDRFGIKS